MSTWGQKRTGERRRAARTPQCQGEHDRHDRESGRQRRSSRCACAPRRRARAADPRLRRHVRHSRHEVTRTQAMWEALKSAPAGTRDPLGGWWTVLRAARRWSGQRRSPAVSATTSSRLRACHSDERRVRGRRRAARALRLVLPLGASPCSQAAWREPRRPLRQRHDGSRRPCLPRVQRPASCAS